MIILHCSEIVSFDRGYYFIDQVFIKHMVALVVKHSPANAEDIRDVGLIPGLGRFPGMATHSNILAWIIPQTEEPGRL